MTEPGPVRNSSLVLEFLYLLITVFGLYFQSIKNLIFGHPRKDIRGKVIVITGAGQGLGRELAVQLSQEETRLALIDVNDNSVNAVAEEVNVAGGEALAYTCDVRNENLVREVIDKIRHDFGHIDILVNNAGIVQCKPFEKLDSEAVKRTFDVNVLSHFWTTKAVLGEMKERGSGHIVAISSIAGLIGTANLVDYCASKHAVVGLMSALEREVHANNQNRHIFLTTICPLVIGTGMFKGPQSRFPSLFPVSTPQYVATKIIDAIKENRTLITIPETGGIMHRLGQIVPVKVRDISQEFFHYGVEAH
ncbi:Epidermal retinol dehydrogenase 2 [Halotydeus destructor]|nr:Epidermal retinol dehydrogenase 2 [Halotydeus destructor]